jgi:hypothetical protein
MIIWGGFSGGGWTATGGNYAVSTNTWTPTSMASAPQARYYHTAVWTGDRMIVWGGSDGSYLDTGGLYDPATDAWEPTSVSEDVERRYLHAAVWTGDRMVVWGGYGGLSIDSGGRYDPAANTWAPTSMTDAPTARWGHTAVWTGAFMLVWGSGTNDQVGGRYALGHSVDDDGDGASECNGDCDDGSPAVYSGAPQLCDGINNDCGDPTWPAVPADELDADLDGIRGCAGDCDDGDANTYPGAPEVNDGVDNQCAGEPGSGMVDEITGDAGFHDPGNPAEYSWPPQAGAATYEVARAGAPDFSADCALFTSAGPPWIDPDPPPPIGGVYYYLTRSIAPHLGSWGENSSGVERTNICQ